MSKILLVDDNTMLLDSLRLSFEYQYADSEILTATNGEDALAQARMHQPDIILCDTAMPRVDGFEVLRQLRADPALRHIPFIFLTAKSSHADEDRGRTLGADDYVTKPFEFKMLFNLVGKYLNPG